MTPNKLMTIAEVAEILNKPKSWIYANGDLIKRVRIGKHYRIRQSDLEAFLDANVVGG